MTQKVLKENTFYISFDRIAKSTIKTPIKSLWLTFLPK